MNDPTSAKQTLRREMRTLRRAIDDDDGPSRSAAISGSLIEYLATRRPTTVMLFAAVPGEPDLTAVIEWCAEEGVEVVAPNSSPAAPMPASPEVFDVVVLPGLAFAVSGERLGQGGGWFDRVVAQRASSCSLVGVCFDEQVVPSVPVGMHDVPVDVIITDRRVVEREELGSR